MYVVIFRAQINQLDDQYHEMVDQLHKLAFEQYGCLDLATMQEGDSELTVTYWESEEQLRNWRENPLHREAQELGRQKWYRAYSSEVAEVQRKYGFP